MAWLTLRRQQLSSLHHQDFTSTHGIINSFEGNLIHISEQMKTTQTTTENIGSKVGWIKMLKSMAWQITDFVLKLRLVFA